MHSHRTPPTRHRTAPARGDFLRRVGVLSVATLAPLAVVAGSLAGGAADRSALPPPEPDTVAAPAGAAGIGAASGASDRFLAPYLHLGWGNPPDPLAVMEETGVHWFTLAFVLSNGGCQAVWDGRRPITGGPDERAINEIRAAGGDVVVSFGGGLGTKLGDRCDSAEQLAAAYQQVIDAYQLVAADFDMEGVEFHDDVIQQRIVEALAILRDDNPDLSIYVTFPSTDKGPDTWGRKLINRGASAGLDVDGWVIMPFNFGAGGGSMGERSVSAAEGLAATVAEAYGYSPQEAYRRIGISSMNGLTDHREHVTTDDVVHLLQWAREHDIARFTFWSLNRDRACPGKGVVNASCSGVDQRDWEYTETIVHEIDPARR